LGVQAARRTPVLWQVVPSAWERRDLYGAYTASAMREERHVDCSPHVVLTAAHCGGPGLRRYSVQFLHIDEDAPGPDPQLQNWSEQYFADSFPWQRFVNETGIQDNDFTLWWVENGSDGLAPGVKYGYLGLSTEAVNVGFKAYSFWQNPYQDPGNGISINATIYHSPGRATALGNGVSTPQHFTHYSVEAAPGGSGSSVIGAESHLIVGVDALASAPVGPRTAADTNFVIGMHDGDGNSVFDPVEYDLLMTAHPQPFRLLRFDTPLQHAQWRSGTNGQITLAEPVGSGGVIWLGHVGGARIGPLAYRACWNSPWNVPVPNNSDSCLLPRSGFF